VYEEPDSRNHSLSGDSNGCTATHSTNVGDEPLG